MDPDARRSDDIVAEQMAEAIEEGDVAYRRGTAAAALRHRDFRIFWGGLFASNIGTWMQTVVLGAYALKISPGSAGYVGLLQGAILAPLVLSPISGTIADFVDRRRYLVGMQSLQLLGAFVLAAVALNDAPSKWLVFGIVLAIGVTNAMAGPGMSAISPSLVPKEDLPGAISLFSFQMNMSRVVGPILGTTLYKAFDSPAIVFAINAVTYLFAIAGLLVARYPRRVAQPLSVPWSQRIASGFRIAWNDPILRRVLIILWTLSLLSLNFISFMSAHAEQNLGIIPKSGAYGALYALFGLGAASGAMSVGSFFADLDKARLVRPSLAAFALLLATFGLLRSAAPAYPVVFILGYAYFVAITSLSTVLQQNLTDDVRGRVMALWIMGFGGAVGVAAWLWAPVAEHSLRALLLGGAAWAAVLAVVAAPIALGARRVRAFADG